MYVDMESMVVMMSMVLIMGCWGFQAMPKYMWLLMLLVLGNIYISLVWLTYLIIIMYIYWSDSCQEAQRNLYYFLSRNLFVGLILFTCDCLLPHWCKKDTIILQEVIYNSYGEYRQSAQGDSDWMWKGNTCNSLQEAGLTEHCCAQISDHDQELIRLIHLHV